MERTNEQWKSREVARLLALVETERRYYQEMVANLPVSVAVVNQQGNLVAANRAFRQLYEVGSSSDLRKRSIEQIFPSAELQAVIQSVFESGVGSRPLVIDRTVGGATPQRVRVSVQAIRDWDEDSGLQALIAVEDLAELKPAAAPVVVHVPAPVVAPLPVPVRPEAEVKHAAAPALLDPLPCVIWTAQASDRKFTYVNPSVKTMLEIEREEWLDTASFFSLRIYPADRAAAIAFYDRSLRNPGLHSCEFRMRRTGVWYRETILVEPGSNTITGVITDITARRMIEEQVLQSQRFDAISHVAGRLAHDVNNPLMIVNGYAEDLASAFPPGDARSADMREIQAAGKRIGDLTSHLNSITRKQTFHLTPIDVNAELVRVVERMRNAAGEYLQADCAPSLEPLSAIADDSQLDAILLELAAALVEGGGETAYLVLSAKAYESSEFVHTAQPIGLGDFVEISLLNQSRVAPALDYRLFESLLPGKEPGHEAGPALARAYKTVREWGGSIFAVPEHNQIFVYLKAAPPPPKPEPPPVQAAPVEEAASGPEPVVVPGPNGTKTVEFVRKTTVLIVEDEPGIRALMRKILQREGFKVMEAANGTEALEILKESGTFNLLITDIVMPGMSGLELANRVKQMDPYCGILYMSGFTAETGVESGQFPPGSHFLQKPFTLGSLLRKANEVLTSTPRRPSAI